MSSQKFKIRSLFRRTMSKVSGPSSSAANSSHAASNGGAGASNGRRPDRREEKGADKENIGKKNSRIKEKERSVAVDPEKLMMETRISELVKNAEGRKAEIAALKMEINRLKDQKPPPVVPSVSPEQVEQLTTENRLLRDRLLQLGASSPTNIPLSDAEKEALLQHKVSCSAPPSVTGNDVPTCHDFRKNGGDSFSEIGEASCATPERALSDWDKQSSSSISGVSVACLQDRIQQMEETHYSTNEELQATLQELADLQEQLTDLQVENERLVEEKAVLLESLCSQTERLEDSRHTVQDLRQLLLRDEDQHKLSPAEREHKLFELLKSAQEERDALMVKQEELQQQIQAGREADSCRHRDTGLLRERLKLLESTVEASHAERRLLEKQLSESREQAAADQIELDRLRTSLEMTKMKVIELEQTQAAGEKSELEELLNSVRKEKDSVEARSMDIQEQLSLSQCEAVRLKEQLSIVQEELSVVKAKASQDATDLQYRLDRELSEKKTLSSETKILQDGIHDLELKCQHHLEDKRELKASLCESQKKVAELMSHLEMLQNALSEEQRRRSKEAEEWQQFQTDLLMTVRVANDFKTEAQQDAEKLVIENVALRERIKHLQAEVDRLRVAALATPLPSPSSDRLPLRTVPSPDNTLLSEVSLRRQRQTKLNVKGLIESIESATKQAKANGSRSSSTSSLSSTASDTRTLEARSLTSLASPSTIAPANVFKQPLSPHRDNKPPSLPSPAIRTVQRSSLTDDLYGKRNVSDAVKASTMKTSDVDSKPLSSILATKIDPNLRRNSYADIGDKKDPLAALVKNGGSKRNALLKWCQTKTAGYRDVDITNFSSSWNDGMALCAILHSYLPDKINYEQLNPADKRRNFNTAFKAAESVGIPTVLNTNDMVAVERPDWQSVMTYVTSVYKHFET